MKNLDIRREIRRAGFFNYEVAAKIGLSEQAFSHALTRGSLTDDRRAAVIQALQELKKERDDTDGTSKAD